MVKRLLGRGDHVIIGDAPNGVDDFAHEYLKQRAAINRWTRYIADWNRLGKMAGAERNGRMIRGADQLIAIFAPEPMKSPGTSNAVKQATLKGIPAYVYYLGAWSLEGNADLEADRWLSRHSHASKKPTSRRSGE